MSEIGASWSIVGAGNVGGKVIGMLGKPDVASRLGLKETPDRVLRTDGWHQGSAEGLLVEDNPSDLPNSEVLFVTSPSTLDHEPMLSLMRQQLDSDGVVVTAEKGTLAAHLDKFKGLTSKLGYWATVGGGTKLLPSLELHTEDPDNIREIHLALNATLTYIFGEVSAGRDITQVIHAAGTLGYAEPGATSTYEVIQGEAAGDIPRKLSIVWNTIFPDLEHLAAEAITTTISEEDVHSALNEADCYRYLVSLFQERDYRRAESMTRNKLGGFEIIHEGWVIIGGLQRVDKTNSLGKFRGTNGPEAGFYVNLGPFDQSTIDGETFLMGTGAGPDTTANAMIDNYQHIKRKKH